MSPKWKLSPFLRRVVSSFAILTFLAWCEGIFAITQIGRVAEESRDIQDEALASTAALGELAADLGAFRAAEAARIFAVPPSDPEAAPGHPDGELVQLAARLTGGARQFESLESSVEEKRLFLSFINGWYTYSHLTKTTAPDFAASQPLYEQISDSLNQLVRVNLDQDRRQREESEGIYRSSVWLVTTVVAAITVLGLGTLLAVVGREGR